MYAFWNIGWMVGSIMLYKSKLVPEWLSRYTPENRLTREVRRQALLAESNRLMRSNMNTMASLPDTIEQQKVLSDLQFQKERALKETETLDAQIILERKRKLLKENA